MGEERERGPWGLIVVLATPFGTTGDEQFQLHGANPTTAGVSLCLAVLLGRSELI